MLIEIMSKKIFYIESDSLHDRQICGVCMGYRDDQRRKGDFKVPCKVRSQAPSRILQRIAKSYVHGDSQAFGPVESCPSPSQCGGALYTPLETTWNHTGI
ncbi:hypothetical protein TNCV_3228471 [Trichonephila clavipes]|nr:hypothetical protein TNCV_3228471 [Trichonephila clavipes]